MSVKSSQCRVLSAILFIEIASADWQPNQPTKPNKSALQVIDCELSDVSVKASV